MQITEYLGDDFLVSNLARHYKEYDITDCAISRAKVPHDVKIGDIINVYYKNGRKEGCEWKGDLETSINTHNGT